MTICLKRFRTGSLFLSALSLGGTLAGAGPVTAEPPSYPGYAAASRSSDVVGGIAESLGAVRQREIQQGVRRPDPSEVAHPTNLRQNGPDVNPPLMPGATQSTVVAPAQGPKRGSDKPSKPPQAKVKTDVKIKSIETEGAGAPDDAIAAGPAYLVSAANRYLEVSTLTGVLVSHVALSSFFASDPTGYLFDPHVCYDASIGRFILVCAGRKTTSPTASTCCLAVSATSDPTGVWYKYVLNVGRGGSPPTQWADYPGLGYDQSAIYVSFNMFTFSGNSYNGNRLIILNKALAMAGQPLSPYWTLDNITLPSPPFSAGTTAFAIKPVEAVGSVSPYLMMSRAGGKGLALFKVSNVLATTAPTVTRSFIDTTDFNLPDDAPQLGSWIWLATGDTRLYKTVYRNGVIWTCNGVSSAGLSIDKGQVNFYKINPTGAGSLLEALSIVDPIRHYYYPAIMPDVNGNAVAIFQGSDANSYASIYAARYNAATASFEAPTLIASGTSPYALSSYSPSPWGDYQDAALDVNTGTNVWIQGILATATNKWILYATEIVSSP